MVNHLGDISAVLSSFASLGKILETLRALRRAGKETTPEQYEQMDAMASGSAATFDQTSPEIMALSISLSDDVAEALKSELERIRGNIKRTHTERGISNHDKDQQLESCLRDYCATLNRAKRQNGGILPPDLQRDWDLNLCSTFNFPI